MKEAASPWSLVYEDGGFRVMRHHRSHELLLEWWGQDGWPIERRWIARDIIGLVSRRPGFSCIPIRQHGRTRPAYVSPALALFVAGELGSLVLSPDGSYFTVDPKIPLPVHGGRQERTNALSRGDTRSA